MSDITGGLRHVRVQPAGHRGVPGPRRPRGRRVRGRGPARAHHPRRPQRTGPHAARGVRTGRDRTPPVVHVRDGARPPVFASNGGSPQHPDRYHNVRADPRGTRRSPRIRSRRDAVRDAGVQHVAGREHGDLARSGLLEPAETRAGPRDSPPVPSGEKPDDRHA
ncbi:nitroreductase/quinone reductase family protein [Streptomyces sp. NPDC058757]|uniref:nitroreductase/quinone reductase family protein n=1 Tax=Streptomyces sp. NPDC058757 TaxID=3346626 RepID=UPI00369FD2A5